MGKGGHSRTPVCPPCPAMPARPWGHQRRRRPCPPGAGPPGRPPACPPGAALPALRVPQPGAPGLLPAPQVLTRRLCPQAPLASCLPVCRCVSGLGRPQEARFLPPPLLAATHAHPAAYCHQRASGLPPLTPRPSLSTPWPQPGPDHCLPCRASPPGSGRLLPLPACWGKRGRPPPQAAPRKPLPLQAAGIPAGTGRSRHTRGWGRGAGVSLHEGKGSGQATGSTSGPQLRAGLSQVSHSGGRQWRHLVAGSGGFPLPPAPQAFFQNPDFYSATHRGWASGSHTRGPPCLLCCWGAGSLGPG